jgi:hypothetical protein
MAAASKELQPQRGSLQKADINTLLKYSSLWVQINIISDEA